MEKLPGDEGGEVELDDVLMIADDDKISVGQPRVEGAKVKATILSQNRDKKIIVFKYKSKIRYRRKRGHRQSHTRLAINEIVAN